MDFCVKLHRSSPSTVKGQVIYLNPDHIIGIEKYSDETIIYTSQKEFFVQEDIEEVRKLIFPVMSMEDLLATPPGLS